MATRALVYEEELLSRLRKDIASSAEFRIATGLMTITGVPLLADAMRQALRGGGRGEVLAGVDLPTQPDAFELLLQLRDEFPGQVSVKVFVSPSSRWFHPKLFITNPRRGIARAIVGSSNVTAGGLRNNYEASFWSDDSAAVRKLLEYFEELDGGAHARPITRSWLAKYRIEWERRAALQKEWDRERERIRRIPPTAPARLPKRIKGHKFVFTGAIDGWPRERRLYPRVRKLGGTIGEKAAGLRGAACLVHSNRLGGKRATLKLKAARRQHLPLMTEDEFLRLLLSGRDRVRKH